MRFAEFARGFLLFMPLRSFYDYFRGYHRLSKLDLNRVSEEAEAAAEEIKIAEQKIRYGYKLSKAQEKFENCSKYPVEDRQVVLIGNAINRIDGAAKSVHQEAAVLVQSIFLLLGSFAWVVMLFVESGSSIGMWGCSAIVVIYMLIVPTICYRGILCPLALNILWKSRPVN